jgi:UPF0042 nucleotide-binding protein
MKMIIVSGLSGSGKSIALETLEDLGYYCVDNLPLSLLQPFAQAVLARETQQPLQTTAVGIDARNFPDELERFSDVLAVLYDMGLNVEVLFLHTDDDVLYKRFSETRRKHPLSIEGVPLAEAVRRERQLLEAISAHATLVIDTSHTNIYDLRELVRTRIHSTSPGSISLLFESFGFKNGVPADADFVFDVRCLPNPHWEPKLRAMTGLDPNVAEFLQAHDEVNDMVSDIRQFLDRWINNFETSDRNYLTVAIGCTGGQHRSVYLAAELARYFARTRRNVVVRHRELNL